MVNVFTWMVQRHTVYATRTFLSLVLVWHNSNGMCVGPIVDGVTTVCGSRVTMTVTSTKSPIPWYGHSLHWSCCISCWLVYVNYWCGTIIVVRYLQVMHCMPFMVDHGAVWSRKINHCLLHCYIRCMDYWRWYTVSLICYRMDRASDHPIRLQSISLCAG